MRPLIPRGAHARPCVRGARGAVLTEARVLARHAVRALGAGLLARRPQVAWPTDARPRDAVARAQVVAHAPVLAVHAPAVRLAGWRRLHSLRFI